MGAGSVTRLYLCYSGYADPSGGGAAYIAYVKLHVKRRQARHWYHLVASVEKATAFTDREEAERAAFALTARHPEFMGRLAVDVGPSKPKRPTE